MSDRMLDAGRGCRTGYRVRLRSFVYLSLFCTICYVGSKVMDHQTILYSWYYINNVVNIKRIFSLSTTIYLQP